MINVARIDAVLQFALAAAAQEDEARNRELGPIHLIKYAYLADLAYAEGHGGDVFTGIPWRFYHFGPWAQEIFERVEPAVAAVGAERRTFTSAKYEGEGIRYSLTDEALLNRVISRQLPWEVASSIKREVHEHGSDTYGLLNRVYTTKPMLRAAPGEYLDFRPEPEERPPTADPGGAWAEALTMASPLARAPLTETLEPPIASRDTSASWKDRRTRKEGSARLRDEVRRRLEARLSRPVAPVRPPRYDAIFFDGVKWLDQQTGETTEPFAGEAVFSPDIWKSRGRSDPDGS